MTSFRFIHAADLHLDSPLIGLAGKSVDFAQRVEAASRQAFDNLIALAIDEKCRFVILAGDIFDGDLKNFQTGLFFMDGMRRLADAGIEVFMILGNHDSANRFADKLVFSSNVFVFPKAKATSKVLADIETAIHGRSFPRWDMDEDMARDYPKAVTGMFNIGVLHTACVGREGGHARYAPCTVEQLANHGYDYWALGHVHEFAILSETPYIVYPGNLQGRHARESGAKGAVLVTVENGSVAKIEHRSLDAVRWVSITLDVAPYDKRDQIYDSLRDTLQAASLDANNLPVALRLSLTGKTRLHDELVLQVAAIRDDVDVMLATLSQEVWLEKLRLATEPLALEQALDPTVAGSLRAEVLRLADVGHITEVLEARLTEIRAKLPAGAHADAFIDQMRAEIPVRAVALARSLVGEVGHAAD